jgi:Tfp pilus assembly protein PilZ
MKDIASQFREYVRLDSLRNSCGLSPSDLHRWRTLKRRLSQHFAPDLSDEHADQRESVRIPTRIAVSFSSEGELARSLMTNLSRKGVYLQTPHLLEIGERFALNIHVEDPPHDISIPVEVVSQNVGPGFPHDPPGMGLRFLDADPEVAKLIDEIYERLLR